MKLNVFTEYECTLTNANHWQMQTLLGSCLLCVIFFRIHQHTYFEYALKHVY